MKPIQTELGFASMLAVPSERRRGGLAMLWKSDVTIDTQTYSPHHIDVQVLMPSTQPWRLTGLYGYSEEQLKPETWRLMRHLYNRSTLPWLCIGDYNEILISEEKNGRLPRPLPPMLAFRNTLLACGLIDLGYHGYRYTWRNGREGEAFVEERLDRVCASLGWSEIYPAAKVHHLTVSYSDHDSILITTAPQNAQHNRRRQKIHCFEEKWVAHPECQKIIRDSWTQTQPSGSPMYCLFEKIKTCRAHLVACSKSSFGNARARPTEKQQVLEELVEQGYEPNQERIHTLRKEINELIHHEEVYWRQRSRSIWLPAGDKNTRFFYQLTKGRREIP
ncbi:uncharacterized protein LOC142639835 [Castanea sativa]|uniref:uncharacterized protein LOC142639835 n=1 Tax=Castanea sativa TaxID=21020 RepID=UPI003F64BB6F